MEYSSCFAHRSRSGSRHDDDNITVMFLYYGVQDLPKEKKRSCWMMIREKRNGMKWSI